VNPQQVLIAVPTRGQIQWATVTRLQEIRDAGGFPPIVYQPGNLSVAQTRNRIVRTFLAGDYDTLVMVDDDIVPSPHFLDSVLPLADGFWMVALPHPMPHPADRSQIILTVYDDELRPLEPVAGLNECAYVATGCVAIAREPLELLAPAPFRINADPAATITSDDFLFCDDLRANGFKVGYWWDGWYADHHTITSLAPLYEARTHVA
jgi:hypothetical protein